jgi:hypothetical protein
MGLEPMTSPLPRECSTTELREQNHKLLMALSAFRKNVGAEEGSRTLNPRLGKPML